MLWMPSSPSTTLPPYFRMGFSACSDVGARFTGAGAKDVVLCSSAYTAKTFMISRVQHDGIAKVFLIAQMLPRYACTTCTASQIQLAAIASVLQAASPVPSARVPQPRRLLGY